MGNTFLHLETGELGVSVSDNMLMDSDGDLMMRMSDNMAMDMDSGEIHMISSFDSGNINTADEDE